MSINDTVPPNADIQPGNTTPTVQPGNTQDAGAAFTQAQLDAIVQSRLADEKRRLQAKYGDLDALAQAKAELDAKRQAELTEVEKLQRQLADKEAEIATARAQAETERLNALRLRVGQELGLPPVLAARLQGADEAALKADAESVKAVLGGGALPTAPSIDATRGGEQPRQSGVKLTPAQQAAARVARKTDEEYAKILQDMQGA